VSAPSLATFSRVLSSDRKAKPRGGASGS